MLIVAALLASTLISLALYFYLANNRGDDQGYRENCRKCLIGGMLCTFGVIAFSAVCSIIAALLGMGSLHPFLKAAFHAFILAALSEELMKWWQTHKAFERDHSRSSWLDVVSYASIVGIGFSLVENAVYSFQSNPIQILISGITTSHATYGMLMGVIYAKGLRENNRSLRMLAVLVATLLHGFYDLGLSETLGLSENLEMIFMIITVGITAALFIYLIRMLFVIKKSRTDPERTAPLLPSKE